ncbi:MAG: cytochrome c biogenesis protein CcdA [Bryobacteraceae bacterium]
MPATELVNEPAQSPDSRPHLDGPLAPSSISRAKWLRAAALALLGIIAAWSWLFVVSKWGPASRVDILTFKAGVTNRIMRLLLKEGQSASGHHSHTSAMVSGLYATPTYYAMTEQNEEADKYLPEKYSIFYLFEDIHAGELSGNPPMLVLRLSDGRELMPTDTELLRDSFHHRATVARFANTDASGKPLIDGKVTSLELIAHDPQTHLMQSMKWPLPILYPKDVQAGNDLSLPTLFGLLAGLLAVLSPCLLQLTTYYTFALAGINMQPNITDTAGARAQVMRTALWFVAGFTIVFTGAGALAGVAGQKLQASGLMASLNRPLMIAAGIGVLILGIWVGANAGAPGLCKLPGFAVRRSSSKWMDGLKMMFMGSAFAVGCSTCFGGALFISLMIYVGAVGSATLGAAALCVFSLGIAVPYLLAAFFLSRSLPLLNTLQRASSTIGLVCSVVLIFFGVILITDNFHIPSNILYSLYLGF